MEKMEVAGGEELFAMKLKDLEDQKVRKIWMAERWKEYSLNNIQHVYEAQKKQADEEFEFERQGLEAKLLSDQPEKKPPSEKKSKKEVAGLGVGGLPDGGAGGGGGRIMTRNSRRRLRGETAQGVPGGPPGSGPASTDHLPGTKDPMTGVAATAQGGRGGIGGAAAGKMRKLNPPHINYTLTDDEIVQDLSLFYQRGVLTPEERKKLFAEAIDFSPSMPSTNFTDREVNVS